MAWVYYHEVLLFTEHQKPIRDTIPKKYLLDTYVMEFEILEARATPKEN